MTVVSHDASVTAIRAIKISEHPDIVGCTRSLTGGMAWPNEPVYGAPGRFCDKITATSLTTVIEREFVCESVLFSLHRTMGLCKQLRRSNR
ncbi:uncharacterized protein BCR38DRAFT_428550, partial [Pseudomassariella vexata]